LVRLCRRRCLPRKCRSQSSDCVVMWHLDCKRGVETETGEDGWGFGVEVFTPTHGTAVPLRKKGADERKQRRCGGRQRVERQREGGGVL